MNRWNPFRSTLRWAAAAGLLFLAPALHPQPVEPVRGITVSGEGVVLAEPTLAQAGLGVQVIARPSPRRWRKAPPGWRAWPRSWRAWASRRGTSGYPATASFPSGASRRVGPRSSRATRSTTRSRSPSATCRGWGRSWTRPFRPERTTCTGSPSAWTTRRPSARRPGPWRSPTRGPQANELARLGGAHRGDLLAIAEVTAPFPQPYASVSALQEMGGAAPSQPGPIEIRVTVQVTWALSLSP